MSADQNQTTKHLLRCTEEPWFFVGVDSGGDIIWSDQEGAAKLSEPEMRAAEAAIANIYGDDVELVREMVDG